MKGINPALNILLWSFFISTCVILFVGALILWLLTLPFDPNRKILQQYSCFWSSIYIWVNPFWSVKVYGKENLDRNKTYVLVANHESFMDILVLFRTFLHFKWVSKASMFKSPFLGWNMKMNGYVPIKRGDPESRERCLRHCLRWLKKGSSVLFFPEGSRSHDGLLRPFKPGAFRLALEAGVDILPMIIRGSRDAVPKHSLSLTKRSRMSVEILPSISVKDFDKNKLPQETQRLAEYVFSEIKDALEQKEIVKKVA